MRKKGRGRNPGKPWELLWLEPPKVVSSKSCAEVLTPGPVNVTLPGNGIITDVVSSDEVTLEWGGPFL